MGDKLFNNINNYVDLKESMGLQYNRTILAVLSCKLIEYIIDNSNIELTIELCKKLTRKYLYTNIGNWGEIIKRESNYIMKLITLGLIAKLLNEFYGEDVVQLDRETNIVWEIYNCLDYFSEHKHNVEYLNDHEIYALLYLIIFVVKRCDLYEKYNEEFNYVNSYDVSDLINVLEKSILTKTGSMEIRILLLSLLNSF